MKCASVAGRKQEAQHGPDAPCPTGFVVSSLRKALEVQILAVAPSIRAQAAGEVFGVLNGAPALFFSHIEPYTRPFPDLRRELVEGAEDGFVVPPDAGREDGQLAEVLGVAQAEVERDEAAEGRATEPGGLPFSLDTVAAGDEGHDFFDQQAAVVIGFAAASLKVAFVGVLGQTAVAGVVDSHDDQGLGLAGFDGGVGMLADFPGTSGEGGGGIEQILSVVHVENGVGSMGVLVVAGRQVDDEIAGIGQVLSLKAAVQTKTGVTGFDGFMSRSWRRLRGVGRLRVGFQIQIRSVPLQVAGEKFPEREEIR